MSLTSDELGLVERLLKKLRSHDAKNAVLENYYEGKQRLKDLGISVPPSLRLVDSVVGWAGTAVDVLEERLDFEGYIGDSFGLNDIFRANNLDLEGSLGHKDALIYGVGFIVVGKGAEGEPDPLITIESPKKMTALYDLRTRRLSAALLVERVGVGLTPVTGSLYLPNETIFLEWSDSGRVYDVARDVHNLGRVPVAPLINNPRSGDPDGRSEITKAVRSYTDSAMRTLLGAEVAREFYSAPQRFILGAKEDTFLDQDGNPLNPWSVIQGRTLGVPYNDDDGVMPVVGQFQANSPAPYFEQIRQYAQLIAAETAVPASYLGFQTDNPSSADAIRQMEARLVKRAERRQKQFGRTWAEVARLAVLVRDGVLPEGISEARPIWRDASTPTRAAAADEAVKLISAGVLLPDSEVTYNRIGLNETDKAQLRTELRAAQGAALVANLADAARAAVAPATTEQGRPQTVETFNGMNVGDLVTLQDGRTGRVEHIMIGGTLGVPGSEFAIQGTNTDPALQVRIFENGTETEVVVNVRFSEVSVN